MLEYYFAFGVGLFAIVFIIQGSWKLNKYNPIFIELNQTRKKFFLTLIFFSNSFLIILSIFPVILHLLGSKISLPELNIFSQELFKYIGFFLLKICWGWIIISSFEISRLFSFIKTENKFKRIFKIELISQIGVWIFLLSNFLFLPNILTLLVCVLSIIMQGVWLNKIRINF